MTNLSSRFQSTALTVQERVRRAFAFHRKGSESGASSGSAWQRSSHLVLVMLTVLGAYSAAPPLVHAAPRASRAQAASSISRAIGWRRRVAPSLRTTSLSPVQKASPTQAPTSPTRFAAFDDYCGDVFLVWNASSDDQDSARAITYEIYVNGELEHTVVGQTWAAFETTSEGRTAFAIVAVDSAGNASAAATYSLVLDGSCD